MTRPVPDAVAAAIDAIRAAHGAAQTLEIIGTGSRRGFGHAITTDGVLDAAGLAGVVDYDMAELVITARPGTPVAEIAALLAANGQHLAFEPPDLAPIWGGGAGAGTLGGLVAAGLAGPRRLAAGGVRDHVLGFEAINGTGERFVAGGKVLKNVTGYDLPKIMAGSWGTLALLTEISLKALPVAASSGSIIVTGLDAAAAVAMLTAALQGPVPITGAAHLPGQPARTLLRLEATTRVLAVQRAEVSAMLGHKSDWLESAESAALWHAVGSVAPLVPDADAVLWRMVLPATHTPAVLARLESAEGWFLDWGGALIWLWHAVDAPLDVRAALAGTGGHATLARAPAALKARVPVFPPLPPAHAALQARVRASFDPKGVFNPGRLGG